MNLQKRLDTFITNQFDKQIEFRGEELYTLLRESETIEFKKSLSKSQEGISKDYLKTICGFANNDGGVIVFGIEPNTHQFVGIKPENKDLDNRFVTTTVNNGFDGNVKAFLKTKNYSNIVIGFLLVEKAKERPVILKHYIDTDAIEGDIIFRYPGQTKRIHSSDLRKIINEEIKSHTDRFFERINQIATIGVENAAILNTLNGEVSTEPSNVKLILSPELLNDLNLIPEANIVENDGAPAYVIKGTVHPENTTFVEKQIPTTITPQDLYKSFIQEDCVAPSEYLKNILYQQTHYYPLYFFIQGSGKSISDTIGELESTYSQDIKQQTKKRLIERLKNNKIEPPIATRLIELKYDVFDIKNIKAEIPKIKHFNDIKGNREKSIAREILYRFISAQGQIPKNVIKQYVTETIEALSHLEEQFIKENKPYILKITDNILQIIGVQENTKKGNVKTEFNKVICRIDFILHNT
jgi:Putative DNA-binding domain